MAALFGRATLVASRSALFPGVPARTLWHQLRSKSSLEKSLIDCSKVYVKNDDHGGAGAFAAVPIKAGEVVERGIARRLPLDGNACVYVFTWSEDRTVWAMASGCAVFYNTDLHGNENVKMNRYFDEDRFEFIALRDIEQDEELRHVYKSMSWRKCFEDLHEVRSKIE
mmetsp:Transcript_13119/g.28915  ORF Transcript_13119/g.28915 Transcript_13119/m.28915 type:complete len:168 (+) Transcript_13119:43-546(+)